MQSAIVAFVLISCVSLSSPACQAITNQHTHRLSIQIEQRAIHADVDTYATRSKLPNRSLLLPTTFALFRSFLLCSLHCAYDVPLVNSLHFRHGGHRRSSIFLPGRIYSFDSNILQTQILAIFQQNINQTRDRERERKRARTLHGTIQINCILGVLKYMRKQLPL